MDLTGIPGGQYSSREDAGSDKLSRTSPWDNPLTTCRVPGVVKRAWSPSAMSHSPKPTLPKGSAAFGSLAPPSFEDTERHHPRTFSRPLYAIESLMTTFS